MGAESELKDDKSDEGGKNCYEVASIWVHVVISSDGIRQHGSAVYVGMVVVVCIP